MGQQILPPGFRFSPTDDELVSFYLKRKALGQNYHQAPIANVDVYKFEPWDLPGKAALPSKDQEWYFFSAQDRKYSHTARINRTTKEGYWKATGKDRKVLGRSSVIGLKKTLIYYEGRAPNGRRTNWIMHEYRLDEEFEKKEGVFCAAVLCRIRKKSGPGPRNGEQYGAPVINENVELLEEVSMGKVDGSIDTNREDDVESRGGGHVYNLTDQANIWKQMELSNATSDHSGTKNLESILSENRLVEVDSDMSAYWESILNASGMANEYGHSRDAPLSWEQFIDESKILNGILDSISDGKGVVAGSTASRNQPTTWSMNPNGDLFDCDDRKPPLDGFSPMIPVPSSDDRKPPLDGFSPMIPLPSSDDRKPPLDGFSPMIPVHSSEFERFEEEQLRFMANTNVETPKLLHSQPSAQTFSSPTRACYGRHENAQFALPQGEKYIWGGDTNVPMSEKQLTPSGKHHFGAYSGAGDSLRVVESSSRSYLSKHVSTYAVSKLEMLPAQLCYASSFTDRQSRVLSMNSSAAAAPSTIAVTITGSANIDADTLGKVPGPPTDSPPSPRPLTKSSKDIAADVPKNSPSTVYSPLLSSSPNESTISPNVELSFSSQALDRKAEHENMSNSSRHRWKTPFRVLVSRAKRSSLGMRLTQLENGMWVKFYEKRSAFEKPDIRISPTRDDSSLYNSLMRLLATLCYLVAATLVILCLLWGFRVMVGCASSVLV